MGKGGGGGGQQPSSVEAERLARIQGDIAQGLFDQSSPIRKILFGQTRNDLGGLPDLRDQVREPLTFDALDPISTEDITANPAFAAQKAFTEQQFSGAREAAIANAPRGGVLQELLGDVELGRAQQNTQNFGQLAQQEVSRRERERAGELQVAGANRSTLERDLDRILGQGNLLGTGQTGQALSGLSSATSGLASIGANQAAIAQAQSQSDAGKAAGTGQAIGRIGFGLATKTPK